MNTQLTASTPEAQLAIWNSEAQRLGNSIGFSDLSSSLFGVWGLMEQEIELLQQTDENSTEFLENNLKYLLSESRWNQQTAFRNYLGIFFNKLQQHARTPMQFPMKDKEVLGFDDEEYALFWHNKHQHPYLDLVDPSIPANLLVREIDFSQTIFHRQCKRLLSIVDHLQPSSPQYQMLKVSGHILSAFKSINDKSNNACGTGICTFFGATLASKFDDNHQTVQIAITALSAAGGQIVPSTLKNISSVLSDRYNQLKNQEIDRKIPSSEIEDLIKALLENKS